MKGRDASGILISGSAKAVTTAVLMTYPYIYREREREITQVQQNITTGNSRSRLYRCLFCSGDVSAGLKLFRIKRQKKPLRLLGTKGLEGAIKKAGPSKAEKWLGPGSWP